MDEYIRLNKCANKVGFPKYDHILEQFGVLNQNLLRSDQSIDVLMKPTSIQLITIEGLRRVSCSAAELRRDSDVIESRMKLLKKSGWSANKKTPVSSRLNTVSMVYVVLIEDVKLLIDCSDGHVYQWSACTVVSLEHDVEW